MTRMGCSACAHRSFKGSSGPADASGRQQSYVERMNAEIPLFEENEAELGARVEAKLLEGAEQLQRQLRMVSDHDGGNEIETLRDRAAHPGRRRDGPPLPCDYGVFDTSLASASTNAPYQLERRMLQQLRRMINSTPMRRLRGAPRGSRG